jgi:hypothetical protein
MKPIKANKSIFAPPVAKQENLLSPAILVSFILEVNFETFTFCLTFHQTCKLFFSP